ncbi:MAG: heme iron utilization protein [Sulfurimonas sp.]|nr:MAG: heme iron utilization protein [Sulfurimonas sp.]
MKQFISKLKTAVIGSINTNATPFSSYAPFIYDSNKFYIYISSIATHTKNIQRNNNVSLFFIEDESQTSNFFARKRISLQTLSSKIARDSARFEEVFSLYNKKFDEETVTMLKNMKDFNLFELEVQSGEATFGFGEAYHIGGENMNELVERKSSGGHNTQK